MRGDEGGDRRPGSVPPPRLGGRPGLLRPPTYAKGEAATLAQERPSRALLRWLKPGCGGTHPTRALSDHKAQFVEGVTEAGSECYVGPEIVETPAKVLDEGMSGDDDPGGAITLQPAHRCVAMAERKPAKKGTQRSAKSTTAIDKESEGFTDEERAAMKERAQELKAEGRRGPRADKADGESAVLAKIAEMQGPDCAMAKRLHAIIQASAPALSPKTWYGIPDHPVFEGLFHFRDGRVIEFWIHPEDRADEDFFS